MHWGKYDIEKDFIVTIELQFANEINSDPSQPFIQHTGLKRRWMVACLP